MVSKEAEILRKYLPAASIDYCFSLWKEHQIQLTISRPRKSIYGNYQFRGGAHYISVNGDLNKEAFLVTYLHEVAHLIVRKKYRRRMKPHGKEWQIAFSEMMSPVLKPEIFPDNILNALKNHLQKPSATSCTDPVLHSLLKNEQPGEHQKRVQDLREGDHFLFQEKLFEWRRKLRTHCEVRSIHNGKIFRISCSALVEPITDPMPEGFSVRKNPTLRNLPVGQTFFLENRLFRKLELRRSRVLCEELAGGIQYLIGAEAEVLPERD